MGFFVLFDVLGIFFKHNKFSSRTCHRWRGKLAQFNVVLSMAFGGSSSIISISKNRQRLGGGESLPTEKPVDSCRRVGA